MAALERFIQRSIQEQFPKRKRNNNDDITVIQEAARAAAEALRNGVGEVQLDIWYE